MSRLHINVMDNFCLHDCFFFFYKITLQHLSLVSPLPLIQGQHLLLYKYVALFVHTYMLLLCSYVNRHDFFESLFFLSPVVACGCAAGVPPEWTNAPGLPSVLSSHSSVLLLASLSICTHQIPRGAAMSCVLKQECSCFVIHPGSYLLATNLSSFTNLPPTLFF